MALPTLTEAKAYLRLDTDVEDDLLTAALATAQALIEEATKVSIQGETRTFEGRMPGPGYRGEALERLTIPSWPCNTTATITDVDAVEVDASTYTVDPRTGWVNIAQDEAFDNKPYTVVVAVGMPYHPNYTTVLEPLLRQGILDLTADIYKRRVSSVDYEQSGGQVSVTYTSDEMAKRTRMIVQALRPRGRAW